MLRFRGMKKPKERPRESAKISAELLDQVRELAKQERRMVTFQLDIVIQAGLRSVLGAVPTGIKFVGSE